MRRKWWRAVPIWLATAVLVAGAAGCGDDDDGAGGGGEQAGGQEKVKTALVLPCATSDPWCKQGFDGAKALERRGEIDLEVTTSAPQDTAGVTRVLAQYAQGGNQLLLAHSTWQDAAFDVAEQFPDVNIATYAFELRDNVAILEEPIYQAAYLAGMLAGGITESNTIGGSAGQDVPLCHAELEAFEAGAKRVNKQVKMIDTYIGDWNDAAKGKQATQAQIDQGADVVIACGGGPATGMAQAIKEANISGFGYVGDMSSQAPKNLVGSVMYNLEPYFEAAVKDVRNDSFRPAKRYEFGLADGGVDLKLNDRYAVKEIPADVMRQMEQVKDQIASGEFKVPYEAGT
ncbi:MAG: BMP family protein [Thermoleophilaceae bacterium]|nr:BMP family protein [Thermoleophilaceae bacterium]